MEFKVKKAGFLKWLIEIIDDMTERGVIPHMQKTEVKQIIESLRAGVIPAKQERYLQILHHNLLKNIQGAFDDLQSGIGFVKWLSGTYGSGKSILLRQSAIEAQKKGFVVVSLSLTGGLRLNRLEQWYYGIMHHLSASNKNKPLHSFSELFDEWIRQLKSEETSTRGRQQLQGMLDEISKSHQSFARALTTYIRARVNQDSELANASASWLSGEKNIPYHIKSQLDVKGEVNQQNTLEFLQGFLSLVKWLGYNGVVILIDEVEMLLNERKDIRQAAYENLRLMIDWTFDGTLQKCGFIFAGTPQLYLDQEKGIPSYEALYQRIGINIQNNQLVGHHKNLLQLASIHHAKLTPVTSRIIDLYHFCNPLPYQAIDYSSIENWTFLHLKQEGHNLREITVRTYIQRLIEVLDTYQKQPTSLYRNHLKMIERNNDYIFINHKGNVDNHKKDRD